MLVNEDLLDVRNDFPKLSVIIPVYNKEKSFKQCFNSMKNVLDTTKLSYEVLIVDDGSTDNTKTVILEQMNNDSRIKTISFDQNIGKGYAIQKGILHSKGELVMFIDGDLDISPEVIKDYLIELENCDLAIASKKHPSSVVRMSFTRKFLSDGFNILVKMITGLRVSDTQVGLKVGNGNGLRLIASTMLVKRYAFDVEFLTIANILGMKIKEMPVNLCIDCGFKLKEIVKMFKDVLAIGYRLRILKWYQKKIQKEYKLKNYSR